MNIKYIDLITPCHLNIELDNNNYQKLHISEYLSHEPTIMSDFINNLKFIYFKLRRDGIAYRTFAIGKNHVLYTFNKKNTRWLPETKTPEYSKVCKMNRDVINKIDNKIIGLNNDYSKLYQKFFLDIMFNNQSLEKQRAIKNDLYLETNDFIMIPNLHHHFLTHEYYKLLHDFNNSKKKIKPGFMKDVIFMIIIKPNNYDELKNLYSEYIEEKDNLILDKLCHTLYQQPFRSVYHMDYNDKNTANIFVNMKKEIIIFYKKFNYNDNDVMINLSDQFANNAWINIRVQCIDKNVGDSLAPRITNEIRSISIDELLNFFEYNINPGDAYQKTLSDIEYKYYDIEENCYEPITDIINLNDKEYFIPEGNFIRRNKMDPPELDISNKIFDLNISGAFMKNFTINRIYFQKLSDLSSFCSISVCITIDNKNYLLNIKPITNKYILKLSKENIEFVQNYLFHNWNNHIITTYHNNEVYMNTIYKKDLYYEIEIIDTEYWNCGFNNLEYNRAINIINTSQNITDREKAKYFLLIDEYTRPISITYIYTNYHLEREKSKISKMMFPASISFLFLSIAHCMCRLEKNNIDVSILKNDIINFLYTKNDKLLINYFSENKFLYEKVDNQDHNWVLIKSVKKSDKVNYLLRQVIVIDNTYENLENFITETKKLINNYKNINVYEINLYRQVNNTYDHSIFKNIYKNHISNFNFENIRNNLIYRVTDLFNKFGKFKSQKYILDKIILNYLKIVKLSPYSVRFHPMTLYRPGSFDFHIKFLNRGKVFPKLYTVNDYSHNIANFAFQKYNVQETTSYIYYFKLSKLMFYKYKCSYLHLPIFYKLKNNDRQFLINYKNTINNYEYIDDDIFIKNHDLFFNILINYYLRVNVDVVQISYFQDLDARLLIKIIDENTKLIIKKNIYNIISDILKNETK